MAAKRKGGRTKGQLPRKRANAAYRRANRERVAKVQGAIEEALAEGARLREQISKKIERRGTAKAASRGRRGRK